jgi:hypothetical protein
MSLWLEHWSMRRLESQSAVLEVDFFCSLPRGKLPSVLACGVHWGQAVLLMVGLATRLSALPLERIGKSFDSQVCGNWMQAR